MTPYRMKCGELADYTPKGDRPPLDDMYTCRGCGVVMPRKKIRPNIVRCWKEHMQWLDREQKEHHARLLAEGSK